MTLTQARATSGRVSQRLLGWAGPLWMQLGVVYLAIRFVSWILLSIAVRHQDWYAGVTGPDEHHIDLAMSWDAQWYQRIATDGYPDTLPVGPDGRVQQNPWAFYPVFPYTARFLMRLTGADFATVAPLLALVAGLGAAVLMGYLFRATLPKAPMGVAVAGVAVWAAAPMAPVLQMAYTESFAMLFLVAFLLFVVRNQWWLAGSTALLLGLTRPIALPLAVVIVVSAFLRWREVRLSRQEATALGFAVIATGLSGILWTTIAWWGTGQRDAYTSTMTAWRGEAKINVLHPWLRTIRAAWEYTRGQHPYLNGPAAFVVPAICIILALAVTLVMLVPKVAPQIDLRLRVWAAAYACYLVAVVDGGTSIVRYLIPLFPVALLAIGAHRPRAAGPVSPWWETRTAFWIAACFVGQIGWIWWLVVFAPLPTGGDYPP